MTPGLSAISHGRAAPRLCLEVLLSVRARDKVGPLLAAWECLTKPIDSQLLLAYDNVRFRGPLGSTRVSQHPSVAAALCAATEDATWMGPRDAGPPDWASLSFADADDQLAPAGTSAHLSLGWIEGNTAARGISLRVTLSDDRAWRALVEAARAVASTQASWAWMTVGYRFLTVSPHSPHFADALVSACLASRRFRAVDIGDTFGFHTSRWVEGLRSIAFWTALSDRVAGPSKIAMPEHPGRGVTTQRIANGFAVQIGDAPALLDVNRAEPTDAYRAADEWLAPARVCAGVNFMPPWDEASSRAWLDRFQVSDADD